MPIFDLDTKAFPMLTPQQTGSFGGVLSDAITKRLALAKAQKEEALAPVARLSALSKANSENAYAGAVTPQFQSKLLENIITSSNIPNSKKREMLARIVQYGAGGTAGTPAANQMQALIQQELQKISNPPQSKSIADSIKELFSSKQPQPQTQAQESGQLQAIGAIPQNGEVPSTNQPASLSGNEIQDQGTIGGDWNKNIGMAKGTIAQGEKEGGARADAIAQYGADTKAVLGQQRASKQILNLLKDPDITKMIQIPFFNSNAQSAYAQAGNKKVQEKIGRLDTAILNYIAASPQKTDADKAFLESQKPNKDDPLHVKLGKLAQLEIYNEGNAEQIKLANKYVRQGYDQATAEIMAAQDVDMDKIENKVNREVFGKPKKEFGHLSREQLEKIANG